MNPVLPRFIAPPKAPANGLSTGNQTKGSTINADAFSVLLTGKVSAKAAAQTGPLAVNPADAKRTALEAKIAKMLKAGASEAQIVSTLAAQLGDSVAQDLGIGTSDARARLQAAFAAALAPPGDGGEAGSSIDRSRAIAQRFLKLQSIASTIVDGVTGQQNRIAGNFLDATKAKETPASTTSSEPRGFADGARNANVPTPIGRSTPGGTAGGSPAAVNSTVAAVAQWSPVARLNPITAGDTRSVKFDTMAALATGGDTTLGRILTRAAVAAQTREIPATAQTAASNAESVPADGQPSTALSPADTTAQSAVTTFVKSFEAALGTAAQLPQNARHDTADSAASLPMALAGHEAPNVPAAFVPAVAPLSIEQTAPPVPPAPVTHTVPADQSAIVDQVLRGAFMRNTGESSEMRLSLVPESLGDVSVKLVVTAGNVTAHVVAQTPEVRDALVAAQPQLTKSLADAGLKLQSFTVDLSGGGFAGFSQPHGNQSQNGNRARQTALSNDGDSDDFSLDASPSFAPSILTTSRAGDYNYLA